jgi:CheY-like chemotaxis protein
MFSNLVLPIRHAFLREIATRWAARVRHDASELRALAQRQRQILLRRASPQPERTFLVKEAAVVATLFDDFASDVESRLFDLLPERRRVLIVEDDPDLGEALAQVIASAHEVVAVESNTLDALGMLAERIVDVLVADYQLSDGTTGLVLFDRVRAVWPTVRRILFTGDAEALAQASRHQGITHAAVAKGQTETLMMAIATLR